MLQSMVLQRVGHNWVNNSNNSSSMSSSNCCFLTHIQVSQEIGKVDYYIHLFKTLPQFIVIHTAKDFSIVNEAEVDIFLEFPCFLHDPTNVDL